VLKNIGVGAGKFLGVRRIFSQISPNFPENIPKKMASKEKRLHFDFNRYFCKIKEHAAIWRRYSQILPKFPNIFCPDFYKKFWGCACTPPPTPVLKNIIWLSRKYN